MRLATPTDLQPSPHLATARAHVMAADTHPDTSATRDRMLEFADAHPDALLRTCVVGHFTGSALVVAPATRQLLLLHHTKLRRWLQPGGHADGDGNLAAVALREATEETGIDGLRVVLPAIDLDVHRVAPPAEGPHDHYDVRFLVLAPADGLVRGNHESTAQRWVGIEELDALGCDPGVRRMAQTGLAVLDRLPAAITRRGEPGTPGCGSSARSRPWSR